MRVQFVEGEQRKFIGKVIIKTGSPSLSSLRERFVGVSYSQLKNYYSERRLLPLPLFEDFCFVLGISPDSMKVVFMDEYWGQKKGGMVGKRKEF